MDKHFYDSVDLPEGILKAYNRIFYLRNLFQDANLFEKELQEIEADLVANLPILDEPESAIETYAASELTMGDLEQLYKEDIRPIVIRGFAKDHDCVKLWTPEYFQKLYGAYKIFFTSTEKIFNETGTTLSDFIDQVLAGSKNRAYIENMSDIFNDFPELHEQVGIEKIEKYFGDYASYHRIAQLFIGGLSTGAVYHCANELNCFFQIYGHKKWTFVHPKYSIAMGTTLMNKGYFVGSFVKHRSPKGFIEANTPLYNRIPKLSIVLEPGDVLFNPPWWWHAIDNQTPSTIAVATRWQIQEDYIRQNPYYDFVQSMRLERLSSFGNQIKNGEVVIPDTKLRRNYISYEKMGWKGK
jgi:hypothetical protein